MHPWGLGRTFFHFFFLFTCSTTTITHPHHPPTQTLQSLRLMSLFWGPTSIVSPPSLTNWSGAGWLCRIYITASLGVFGPLAACFTLFFFITAIRRNKHTAFSSMNLNHKKKKHQSESHSSSLEPTLATASALEGDGKKKTERRRWSLVGQSLLFSICTTLPIACLQTASSWLSYWVQYQGQSLESQPRTVLGYFFAVYWYNTGTNCNEAYVTGDSHHHHVPTSATSALQYYCTLCTFPATTAIVHVAWTTAFLVILWVLLARVASLALNKALQKRLTRLFIALCVPTLVGCICVGCTVITDPFSWVNQGLWVGYATTVVVTVVLSSHCLVLVPTHTDCRASRVWVKQQEEQMNLYPLYDGYRHMSSGGGTGDGFESDGIVTVQLADSSARGGEAGEGWQYRDEGQVPPPPPPPPPSLLTQKRSGTKRRTSLSQLFPFIPARDVLLEEDEEGDEGEGYNGARTPQPPSFYPPPPPPPPLPHTPMMTTNSSRSMSAASNVTSAVSIQPQPPNPEPAHWSRPISSASSRGAVGVWGGRGGGGSGLAPQPISLSSSSLHYNPRAVAYYPPLVPPPPSPSASPSSPYLPPLANPPWSPPPTTSPLPKLSSAVWDRSNS